jgi:hypothetical protein
VQFEYNFLSLSESKKAHPWYNSFWHGVFEWARHSETTVKQSSIFGVSSAVIHSYCCLYWSIRAPQILSFVLFFAAGCRNKAAPVLVGHSSEKWLAHNHGTSVLDRSIQSLKKIIDVTYCVIEFANVVWAALRLCARLHWVWLANNHSRLGLDFWILSGDNIAGSTLPLRLKSTHVN